MGKSNYDSPDPWAQIKAAKENLFNSAQFSKKYRPLQAQVKILASIPLNVSLCLAMG